MTVFLGVGDERFRDCIRGKNIMENKESPFLVATASFVHFTLFQAIVLINAIIGQSIIVTHWLYTFITCWIFIYATLLSIAAIFAAFKLAVWFDNMPKNDEKNDLQE
jgi:hypothetical protein